VFEKTGREVEKIFLNIILFQLKVNTEKQYNNVGSLFPPQQELLS
jgi:hypothetical protein